MKKSNEEIKSIVTDAINKRKIVSFVTFLLSDYGEKELNLILRTILERFDRVDLLDIAYTSAKELILNATKANLKRMLFRRLSLDIENPQDYETGMNYFKSHISEDKLKTYKADFRKYDLPVTATFYYSPDVLNIKVKNNFKLLDHEESRIRDKFGKAKSFASLLDFFVEHGDSTEGAGMGLTMVGILLDQSGIDKHSFILYNAEKYGETAAKLEIPLARDYISKRKMFEIEMNEKGITAEELRKTFSYNYKDFGVWN